MWLAHLVNVEVLDFTVYQERLRAVISVSPNAAPGKRNITIDNGGGDVVVLYDGLKIDRVSLAASFEPVEAKQGETLISPFALKPIFCPLPRRSPSLIGMARTLTLSSMSSRSLMRKICTVSFVQRRCARLSRCADYARDDSVRVPDAFEVLGEIGIYQRLPSPWLSMSLVRSSKRLGGKRAFMHSLTSIFHSILLVVVVEWALHHRGASLR